MGLFIKTFAVYFLGMTDIFYSLYMPIHLAWLEFNWPGMVAGMVDEPRFQIWWTQQQETLAGFALFYGAVYFGFRLLAARQRRLSVVQA